ncbi:type II secretion system GspH family protein [Geomonas sp. RF6]|uniref:type II secretion system protein n=1 Tax=Geomonas sp. RF6 TaxID=2897342 RepID=UPI001E5D959F|nr:type II secretion system protein [Geomonas sp. RF6]UFS70868.1 type II secretion system GspH family protein [Geomonas sp. RF6]
MRKLITNNRGLSLIELVVTLVILSILASVIIPSAQMTNRRGKEIELRANLRLIRTALDDFKKDYDRAQLSGSTLKDFGAGGIKSGYPETLEVLVEGYDFGGVLPYKKKYLRRIPRDPFHVVTDPKEEKWGMRSYTDNPDSTQWGKEDVYDVYSLSDETAIDGTKYKDW